MDMENILICRSSYPNQVKLPPSSPKIPPPTHLPNTGRKPRGHRGTQELPYIKKNVFNQVFPTLVPYVPSEPNGGTFEEEGVHAPTVGIEPTTTRLKVWRSTTELGGLARDFLMTLYPAVCV